VSIKHDTRKAEQEDDPLERVKMLHPHVPVLMVLADREETYRRMRAFVATKSGWAMAVLGGLIAFKEQLTHLLGGLLK